MNTTRIPERAKRKRKTWRRRVVSLALILSFVLAAAACNGGGGNRGAEAGDIISFGNINWVVLEVIDGSRALILSDRVLERRAFDSSSNDWETSDIRQYLNGEFYQSNFSSSERNRIIESDIANVGNNTRDKIFLLSSGEANQARYFSSDAERIAMCIDTGAASWWWLRSPGGLPDLAALVDGGGGVGVDGDSVHGGDGGVRPALWLNL